MRITWSDPSNVDILFTNEPGEVKSDNGIENDGLGVFISHDSTGVMIEGDPLDFIYALLSEYFGVELADRMMSALEEEA